MSRDPNLVEQLKENFVRYYKSYHGFSNLSNVLDIKLPFKRYESVSNQRLKHECEFIWEPARDLYEK